VPTSTVAERPAAACVLLRGAVPTEDANALLGGKAAATDRLVAYGFDVPPSAAVTTAAYRVAARDPAVIALLERLALAGDDDAVDADAIDEVFLGVELPSSLEEEILMTARLVAGDDGLAARSSATVEDLAGTSFAGQYRSFLALETDEEILRAVRLVWASLWHPAPRAYRRAYAVDESRIAMAVLLMQMVPSVQAGVAFTRDPGGAAGVRVESVEGLGEQLVSGEVTPAAWLVGPDHDPAPALVERVAEVGRAVERAFGSPMDVEWAWDGSRLWLVQARPITVDVGRGDGFDTAPDGSTLTTAGIAEMLPGVLAPRVWGLAGLAVEEALRRSLDGLGALGAEPSGTYSFIRRVRGRAALDLDALKRVAAALPGGSEAEVERQYFGEVLEEPPDPRARPVRRRDLRILFQDARVLRARRLAVEEADVVVRAEELLAEDRPDLSSVSAETLLGYRRRVVDLGMRAMAAELAVAAAATAAFRRLELTIAGHLGADEAIGWVQRVTTGVALPSARADASMSVFGGPTWSETGVTPAAPPQRRSGREDDLRALEAALQALPRWRATRIMTGQVVDVRVHVLRRLVQDAVTMLGRRERTKAAVLGVGGEVRRIDLELGARRVADGALDESEDIDLVSGPELTGTAPWPPAAELARRRRWIRRCEEDGPLPERFSGVPPPERPPVPAGDQLVGVAGSPGRHTARARVVRAPLRAALRDGEVLVAAATDAGWSPLFLRAGAIVVERGGPLSHAAIVARELGVPSVLAVAGATGRLDGRIVTVDGDLGTVVVHDDRRESST
jgi:rifampicin phosphotransferase